MEFNTYSDLLKQESKVYEETIKESPEIGWFKEFYQDIQRIMYLIPNKRRNDELPENPPIFYLILTSTLQIVYLSNSILHLISRGYYGQGMNLLRSVQEEYHSLLFFNYHPRNQIKQWNEGKIKYKQINSFMTSSHYIPKKWRGIVKHRIKIHKVLSSFVHTSRYGWSGVVKVEETTGDNLLKMLPIYEQTSFNTVFIALTLYLGNIILFLLEIYENELKDSGLYEEIFNILKQCESEYMWPTLQNMRLDIGKEILG